MGMDYYWKIVNKNSEDDSDESFSGERIGDDNLPSVRFNQYFDTDNGTFTSIIKNMRNLLDTIEDPLLYNDFRNVPGDSVQDPEQGYIPKELDNLDERLEAISVLAFLAAQIAPSMIEERTSFDTPIEDDRDENRIKIEYW